jgi:mercuric ion transport protein
MHDARSDIGTLGPAGETADHRKGWVAAGGLIGAILASSCCIIPFGLVMLGISGAWIGNLTALSPYKPYFAAAAAVFIGLGFWQVYFRAKMACADGSQCARPQSSLITKIALWLSAVVVTSAMTIDWWAPLFY